MKETPRRIVKVTSSSNEISTVHVEKRMVVRGEALLHHPPPLSTASRRIFKDDVNVFSPSLHIFSVVILMVVPSWASLSFILCGTLYTLYST
jgi:hypothetical protein